MPYSSVGLKELLAGIETFLREVEVSLINQEYGSGLDDATYCVNQARENVSRAIFLVNQRTQSIEEDFYRQ
jgi:hypothetical protein